MPQSVADQRRRTVEQYARARTRGERRWVAERAGVAPTVIASWRQKHAPDVEFPPLLSSAHPSDAEWDDTEEEATLMRELLRVAGDGLEEWPADVGASLLRCGRAKIAGGRLYIACVVPGVVVRGRDNWRSEARSDDGRSRRVRGPL